MFLYLHFASTISWLQHIPFCIGLHSFNGNWIPASCDVLICNLLEVLILDLVALVLDSVYKFCALICLNFYEIIFYKWNYKGVSLLSSRCSYWTADMSWKYLQKNLQQSNDMERKFAFRLPWSAANPHEGLRNLGKRNFKLSFSLLIELSSGCCKKEGKEE